MAARGLAALSALGTEAVAARVVHAEHHTDELQYFGEVATLPGFARVLARTLGDLRMAHTDAAQLESTGASGRDLARLLRRYENELEARSLADRARVFTLAVQAIEEGRGPLLGLPLVLFDTPLENQAQREFFAHLAGRAPGVLAAVTSGKERAAEILGVAPEDLDSDAPSTPLEHLRRYLFSPAPARSPSPSGFEMFSAPGEGLEAAEIARRILRLAEEGIRFDHIAVLLRNPERYQPMIEEALRRARIPAYFSRGTRRPDPAGRAFLALLACAAEKFSASRFAEYLSLGQVPAEQAPGEEGPGVVSLPAPRWVAPEDELLLVASTGREPPSPPERENPDPATPVADGAVRAPAGWEKLLVDAAVIGGRERWARRLRGLRNEFELRLKGLSDEDEAARQHVERQLEQLGNLEQFALPLIEVLDALPAAAPWREWLDFLARLAQSSLRNPDGVLAVLAEFEPMAEVGPVSVEEVAEVLSDRLRFLRAEPPERRFGRVFVGSIEEARGCEFSAVFLPGLAEGLFPQRIFEDPLLLDEFRAKLNAPLPVRNDRILEERQRLHLAVAAAGERFIASYPRMDVAEARPRVPSFYALELPRALEGGLPKLKDFETRTREAAQARLNWPAPKDTAAAIDDAEYDLTILADAIAQHSGARYLIEANPHLARSLRGRWARWRSSWKEADGLVTHHPAVLEALGNYRLLARPWSASSLEKFAVCPYKFALQEIRPLHPREETAALEYLDPRTRGILFHEVQCALLGELRATGRLPLDGERLRAVLEAGDRTLDRIASRYKEDLAPAIPRVWDTEIEDLRTDLRGWLQHVAQNDGDFEPLYFEFSFGKAPPAGSDPASVREEAVLDEGVRLRGSIDLVEKHLPGGALRITDHKTGKFPERVPAATGGGHTLQPLLYALAAEKLLGTPVESSRLFYATQRGGYQYIPVTVNDRARQFLARLLQDVDEAIAGGFLPPVPEKDACGICDCRPVCGPYEERRTAAVKDRRDERLEGLHEIRSML